MNSEKYLLSFTGVSLGIRESITVAQTYLELRNWDAVEQKVKAENLVQARTKSSIQRVYQEIWPRLSQLSDDLLDLLIEGTSQEQKHILWYAICKRYVYVQEFAIEVIYEKFLRLDYQLTDFDYEVFFNQKADWHPELDQIKASTRQKMKTRIFWMLREAEILSDDNSINPVVLSSRFVETVAADGNHNDLRIFPTAQLYPAQVK